MWRAARGRGREVARGPPLRFLPNSHEIGTGQGSSTEKRPRGPNGANLGVGGRSRGSGTTDLTRIWAPTPGSNPSEFAPVEDRFPQAGLT
jgi:hypothetical protein